jgi:short subunit fatty acids transporter
MWHRLMFHLATFFMSTVECRGALATEPPAHRGRRNKTFGVGRWFQGIWSLLGQSLQYCLPHVVVVVVAAAEIAAPCEWQ